MGTWLGLRSASIVLFSSVFLRALVAWVSAFEQQINEHP